jgi:hypothetical protein
VLVVVDVVVWADGASADFEKNVVIVMTPVTELPAVI